MHYFSSLYEFWSSLLLGYNYDLFHFFNELISHGVFLFFIIWYIHLVTYATKIVTLQLHYALSTYLPNNNKCIYIPTNRRKTIIYNRFLCFWLQATMATKKPPNIK